MVILSRLKLYIVDLCIGLHNFTEPNMKNHLLDEKDTERMVSTSKDSDILELYGCGESPLAYMIEPKGSVELTDQNHKTKKEDLENIL